MIATSSSVKRRRTRADSRRSLGATHAATVARPHRPPSGLGFAGANEAEKPPSGRAPRRRLAVSVRVGDRPDLAGLHVVDQVEFGLDFIAHDVGRDPGFDQGKFDVDR